MYNEEIAPHYAGMLMFPNIHKTVLKKKMYKETQGVGRTPKKHSGIHS